MESKTAKVAYFLYCHRGATNSEPFLSLQSNEQFEVILHKSHEKLGNELHNGISVLILDYSLREITPKRLQTLLEKISSLTWIFKIIIHPKIAYHQPLSRWHYFQHGINMITYNKDDLQTVLLEITSLRNQRFRLLPQNNNNNTTTPTYNCAYCKMDYLDENSLYNHVATYHTNSPNMHISCEICEYKKKNNLFSDVELELVKSSKNANYAVHLHNSHGPILQLPRDSEFFQYHKKPTAYSFSIVVVQRPDDRRYLLVQEFSNVGYWLPGGRVNSGERLSDAAIRETKEEAGIDITLKGVLQFEYYSGENHIRVRAILYAHPTDLNQLPKSIPDYESVGATWVTYEELLRLQLRSTEPQQWFQYIDNGGSIYPLSILRDR